MKYEAWDIDFKKYEDEYLELYKKFSLESFDIENLESRLAKIAGRNYAPMRYIFLYFVIILEKVMKY